MRNPMRRRARELRKESTWAEKRLWRILRSRRLAGYKFRREHPVGGYFLYFYCMEARVAVERRILGMLRRHRTDANRKN